jgi:hypothetical protein
MFLKENFEVEGFDFYQLLKYLNARERKRERDGMTLVTHDSVSAPPAPT